MRTTGASSASPDPRPPNVPRQLPPLKPVSPTDGESSVSSAGPHDLTQDPRNTPPLHPPPRHRPHATAGKKLISPATFRLQVRYKFSNTANRRGPMQSTLHNPHIQINPHHSLPLPASAAPSPRLRSVASSPRRSVAPSPRLPSVASSPRRSVAPSPRLPSVASSPRRSVAPYRRPSLYSQPLAVAPNPAHKNITQTPATTYNFPAPKNTRQNSIKLVQNCQKVRKTCKNSSLPIKKSPQSPPFAAQRPPVALRRAPSRPPQDCTWRSRPAPA